MINLKIDSNINQIIATLPISKELTSKALTDLSEIVRRDIETNLRQGTGLDGKSVVPKRSKGRLYVKSGKLINSVRKQIGQNAAQIFIDSQRAKVASYINYGTSQMSARQFFGVSQRALIEIDNYLLTNRDSIFKQRTI